ncbi:helix-turn-helix domain-containing protein [Actinokineospora soli]|uniref:Helix-turn-helix domain-containing protein n=1 Tax=Actinokineospora soli TaxID=1048753 RepID=A0ABW2TK52_9PSEU
MAKSPKTLALGSALRAARQDKNITLRDFAGQLGIDFGMLSRWENGLRIPKPENVAQILTSLGVVGEQYKGIMTLVRDTAADHWTATSSLEIEQLTAAFRSAEKNSALITSVCPLLIPGLLQIPEYVRAIMVSGTCLTDAEVEERVAARIARQDVLVRPIPAGYTVLLGEAALRQQVGGPAVHLKQLRHLLKMGGRANIDLRVVTFEESWHSMLDGAFHMFTGDTIETTVVIESREMQTWLHRPEHVNRHRRAVRDALDIALSRADSMHFVAGLAHRMEQRFGHLAEVDP